MCCKLINSENIKQFLESFDNILVDCDGVIWSGDIAIEGASETLSKLRKMGKKIIFVTNNSTKSRQDYLSKFHKLGFEAEFQEVFTSSYIAAKYLKEQNFDKKVYLIGCDGIVKELDLAGIKHLDIGPDNMYTHSMQQFANNVELDPEVGAVVAGFDPYISLLKITKAFNYLMKPECLFVMTNADTRFPITKNITLPGTGSLLSSIVAASQRQPIIMGKPHHFMFDAIQSSLNIDPKRSVMIGDSVSTDILFGANNGFSSTVLVLTGIGSLSEVETLQQSNSAEDRKMIPSYYIPCISDIGELMN